MISRVLLSHPHANDNASATAAALDGAGMLARYVTGVAAAEGSLSGRALGIVARRRPVAGNRVLPGVSARHLESLAVVELVVRALGPLAARLTGPARRITPGDATYVAHDAAVAALPWLAGADAVYAYEDASQLTFERARRRSLHRIWDLPLPHYLTLEDMWRKEHAAWASGDRGPFVEPAWKKHRKDRELDLATHVSCASAFTRESIERVGARAPVFVVPYGFPVERFAPKPAAPDGPFTVLAVGTQDLRKGTTYLLEAWRRAGLRHARLVLVGTMRLDAAFLARHACSFEHHPHVPKARLPAFYGAADVLAFPTLGDGFGLVMQEAMCSATPVITTRCGGGPECITDGVDGWIVPERSIDALVERLRACAADRDATRAVGLRARARAERYTWRDAGQALVTAIRGLR